MRALIARFWRAPYHSDLVRWGTSLHDRFMLPHFVWSDFKDVIADMKDHGFEFDDAWFKPHWEFRFPHIGEVQYGDVALELRTALEPWRHVMAEEGARRRHHARYVDSSAGRAIGSEGQGTDAWPPQGVGQWPRHAATRHRARRRSGEERALQGLRSRPAWPASPPSRPRCR